MTFDELLALMKSTDIPFAAAGWAKPPKGDFGTVSYRAFEPLFADDRLVSIQSEAVIVLQSRDNGEDSAAKIQQKLRIAPITWWLEAVEYDEATGMTVWQWAAML
jgi:hypothetical protein